jgi:hypothetical protein
MSLADLETRVDNLASAMGDAVTVLTLTDTTLSGKVGDLSQLTTASKNNLVAALNEIKTLATAVQTSLGGIIDDSVVSAAKVWSSTKTKAAIDAAITGIIDGAPDALNTLKELATEFTSSSTALQNLLTIVAKALRVDIDQSATFTDVEKARGRANLGAASLAYVDAFKAQVGAVAGTNFVSTFRTHAGITA